MGGVGIAPTETIQNSHPLHQSCLFKVNVVATLTETNCTCGSYVNRDRLHVVAMSTETDYTCGCYVNRQTVHVVTMSTDKLYMW